MRKGNYFGTEVGGKWRKRYRAPGFFARGNGEFSMADARLFMTTHMPFDPYNNEETVAEIREHWKGLFHFGARDEIMVNGTKDDIWVREGILPDFPNSRAPQFDIDDGQLVVPYPPTSRQEIQEPLVRDMEIPPEVYYPEDHHPELLTERPVDSDLGVPLEKMPPAMLQAMGENRRTRRPTRSTSASSPRTTTESWCGAAPAPHHVR